MANGKRQSSGVQEVQESQSNSTDQSASLSPQLDAAQGNIKGHSWISLDFSLIFDELIQKRACLQLLPTTPLQEGLRQSLNALTQLASGQQDKDAYKNRYIFWETQPVSQFGDPTASSSQVEPAIPIRFLPFKFLC